MYKTSSLPAVSTLYQHARQHTGDEGSVTAGYSADRVMLLRLLNDLSAEVQLSGRDASVLRRTRAMSHSTTRHAPRRRSRLNRQS